MANSRPPATFGASADAFLAELRARSSSALIASPLLSPAPTAGAPATSSSSPSLSGLSTPSHPTINVSAAAFLASISSSASSFVASTQIAAPASSAASSSTSPSASPATVTVPPAGLPRNGFYFDLADGYDLMFNSRGHFDHSAPLPAPPLPDLSAIDSVPSMGTAISSGY